MDTQKGTVSINAQNIMPIIKKWLYSDKDIFIRELIANACDAITKYNKLNSLGQAPDREDFKIVVTIDPENKTLSFLDNGIGMTKEEVETYINQVAFSGAKDFLAKYEQAGDDAIIGHFGLGFYSAFMVATSVSINTLSFIESSEAIKWTSENGSDFEIGPSEKTTGGTLITLTLDEESQDYLKYSEVFAVIEKYCAFLPYPIYLEDTSKVEEPKEENPDEATDQTPEGELEDTLPKMLNDTAPLWTKNPRDCTRENYIDFYRKVFKTYEEPLFWIHLNVDYPFNLKGILFFPKLNNKFDMIEGQIKLFNNQVFVADNIKEVIPEFLMLLKGVIDCPDLPLNVSRSFLQNDGTVKKMQAHITKKVADKLNGMHTTEPEEYQKDWKDINPFIKFGTIKDDKFYEQAKESLLFEKLDESFLTLEELKELAKNDGGKAYYVSDAKAQANYIDMFLQSNQPAILLDGPIDHHFINFIERKHPELHFARIDSEVAQSIKGQYEDMPDSEKLSALFKKASGDEKLEIEVAPIKSSVPAVLVVDESMRRFTEMSSVYSSGFSMPIPSKLVLNGSNETVKKLANAEGENAELLASYIYDIALLGRGSLTADEVRSILDHSSKILSIITI